MESEDWVINYVKNRDLIERNLIGHEIKGELIKFKFKKHEQDYIIKEVLDESVFDIKSTGETTTIVCLNTEHNVDFVVKNWDKLKKDPKLKVMFVNFSANRKWILSPYTHDKIADPESLETGIQSMYSASLG